MVGPASATLRSGMIQLKVELGMNGKETMLMTVMVKMSCGEMYSTDWTDEEKSAFVQTLSSCGKDFVMVSQCVRTRSSEQCKIFFSKTRKCPGLDKIRLGFGIGVSDAGHGGNSDTEGACVVQTCSVTGNNGSDCRMEEDLPPMDIKLSNESDVAVIHNLNSDSMDDELWEHRKSLSEKPTSPHKQQTSTIFRPLDLKAKIEKRGWK
ncbi:hypothetical protein SASPL_137326 [Salvia splendens]|uniref:SANT domain-containing protein n=1 Tax=Salvia splendens TaxID=180675 RepID=A0A8X8WTH0_SALSN|nr:hypothetical protein SASPL_137326 [Salvia splendens]